MKKIQNRLNELERKFEILEVKFEIITKHLELSALDELFLELDLTGKEINQAIEILNNYSKTEVLNNWETLGITKYIIKRELERVSSVFKNTEYVEELISDLAAELGDENYKILAERLSWKIANNIFYEDIEE